MSSSFDCFEKEFPVLTKLGKLAESYCYTDPNSALYKIRKIGETITALIYEYDSIPVPTGNISDVPQASRINYLQDYGIINNLLAKSFTRLRKIGNEAVHEDLDSSIITFVTKEIHKEIYSRCNVEKGDVLYIKDGATTGIATVNTLDEEFSMLSSVADIKPIKGLLDSKYLAYVMNSSEVKAKMLNEMSGNAITRLTLVKIKNAEVPICSLPEQQEIIRILDSVLEKESRAKEAAEAVLEQIDLLKKSILARAFRGEL